MAGQNPYPKVSSDWQCVVSRQFACNIHTIFMPCIHARGTTLFGLWPLILLDKEFKTSKACDIWQIYRTKKNFNLVIVEEFTIHAFSKTVAENIEPEASTLSPGSNNFHMVYIYGSYNHLEVKGGRNKTRLKTVSSSFNEVWCDLNKFKCVYLCWRNVWHTMGDSKTTRCSTVLKGQITSF